MILPRPSNTGILISAVMVGLLGLGANWFMKLDPKIFQSQRQTENVPADGSTTYLDRLFGKDGSEDTETETEPKHTLPGPTQCVADLEEMRSEVEVAFKEWEKHASISNSIDGRFSSKAEKLCQLVVLDPDATDDQKRKARLTSLAILFRAARMSPQEHLEAFDRACIEVGKGNNENDDSRALALQVFLQCNFARPNRQELLNDLGNFSGHCPSATVAVGVYLSIAKELKRYRQFAVAKDVLELGLSQHNGMATNRLFNELHKRTIPTSHQIR